MFFWLRVSQILRDRELEFWRSLGMATSLSSDGVAIVSPTTNRMFLEYHFVDSSNSFPRVLWGIDISDAGTAEDYHLLLQKNILHKELDFRIFSDHVIRIDSPSGLKVWLRFRGIYPESPLDRDQDDEVRFILPVQGVKRHDAVQTTVEFWQGPNGGLYFGMSVDSTSNCIFVRDYHDQSSIEYHFIEMNEMCLIEEGTLLLCPPTKISRKMMEHPAFRRCTMLGDVVYGLFVDPWNNTIALQFSD